MAEVPFVDVITSMLDDSIPLTVTEWDEWGDPRVREHFDAMLAYSPYDNPPKPGNRPDLLVTGAVHDTRVLVHEPAKWVALLRETDPDWAGSRWAACSASSSAPARTSGRAAASTTSPTRPTWPPGSSTGWGSDSLLIVSSGPFVASHLPCVLGQHGDPVGAGRQTRTADLLVRRSLRDPRPGRRSIEIRT